MKIEKTIAKLKTGFTDLTEVAAKQSKKVISQLPINMSTTVQKSLKLKQGIVAAKASKKTHTRENQQKNDKHQVFMFDEANANTLLDLIKGNKKVVAASVATVLTLTIGVTSIVNYVAQSPIPVSVVASNNVEALLLEEQEQLARIEQRTIEGSTLVRPSATNPLSKVASILEIGPLFDSKTECFVLKVNGKAIAYFKTQQEGEELIAQFKASFQATNSQVISVGFAEDVKIVKEPVSLYDFSGFASVDEIKQLIKTGTNEKRIYAVKNGDVLSTIAESHKMSLTQLYAANPGIESKKYLQIGEELNLVVPVPLINVKTIEKVTYAEAIPYETINEKNSATFKGETAIKVAGANGEKQIVAEVVKVNGQEKSRKILDEKVAKQPVNRILVVGTKAAPLKVGSGKFSKPVSRSYTVSSPFGRRWGSMHTGIDLAMPSGSPVLAADGGKVVFSGSQSTYGKLIVIDHGGNLQSYYAHNSRLLVKKGDKVFKGQKIALSGNTGRSTGPHLHFEIRVNGTPKNPTKYLRF